MNTNITQSDPVIAQQTPKKLDPPTNPDQRKSTAQDLVKTATA